MKFGLGRESVLPGGDCMTTGPGDAVRKGECQMRKPDEGAGKCRNFIGAARKS